MVFGVACPEVMVIVPAEESEDAKEKAIEPAGFKDRIVDEFVKAIDSEVPEVAVGQDKQGCDIPGPVKGRVDGCA